MDSTLAVLGAQPALYDRSFDETVARPDVAELADAEPLMDIFRDPEVVAKKQVTLAEPPGILSWRGDKQQE